MTEFTASNGVPVRRTDRGYLSFTKHEGVDLGIFTGITAEQESALREFFQHERDDELGRWRDSRYPDHVVYPSPRTPQVAGRGVQVLDERTARLYDRWETPTEFNKWDTSPRELAARAYFEAHPERKPWEDAKEGEVWIITPSKSLTTLDGHGEYPAIFQAGRFRDHGGSWDTHDLTAARRIWPEEAS